MTNLYLDLRDGDHVKLPARDGLPEAVHVLDEDSILAVNAALATRRPLLVRGEPGTGKSQLARAAAEALGRAFVPHAVDGRTETRDLLWSVDAVAQLAEAQIMGALHHVEHDEMRRRIDVLEFVQPGPLWWAFEWGSARAQAKRTSADVPVVPEGWSEERGAVVLIDEIDKADSAIPNGLLDALGHGRFDVPGRPPVALDRARPPLVVFTTNEDRALPDAFLRRCLVLHLALPVDADALTKALMVRARAHFPACREAVLQRAAALLARDRAELRGGDVAPPGLAEYLDLVRAVIEQRAAEADQLALLERIAKFALRKHAPEPGR
jgi:MoxR-like ATPase